MDIMDTTYTESLLPKQISLDKILLVCFVIILCGLMSYYYYSTEKTIYGLKKSKQNCPKQLCHKNNINHTNSINKSDCQCPKQTENQEQIIIQQSPTQLTIPTQSIQTIPPRMPLIPVGSSEYYIVGSLLRQGSDKDTAKYKVLPVFGKPYRGGFFKYYIEYKENGQIFRMLISKNNSSTDMSRELYDGDIINVGYPITGSYKFSEQRRDTFADDYYY